MDFIFTAVAATFIGAGLLLALVLLLINPRVGQLISGDWLPECDENSDFEPQPLAARQHADREKHASHQVA